MKPNLLKQLCCFSFLLATIFSFKLDAQVITQNVDMPWGWYWKGSTSSNFDFTKDDLIDQIIYDDNGIYFVGKTESPKSGIAQFANCATTTYLGGTGGDAYIAYRNTMCGDTWTTFFGCSTAKEYAYCIAEDKVSTKKFFYAAGEIDYGSNPSPMTAAACVGTCNTIKQDVVNANDIGKDDGFIAKYDGTGHMIRWTYFGGDGQDIILGIVVDTTTHDVFVTGYTESTPSSFPSVNNGGSTYFPYATNRGGDIFIAQFDSCLNNLKFLGFWTGPDITVNLIQQADRPHGLAIYDDGSNKYLVIAGSTASTSGISKNPPGGTTWDNQYGTNGTNGSIDGFLMEWNNMSNLSTGPLWSTYFGGSAADRVRKTLVMPDGSIYIGGETKSIEDGSKFETTSDALQGTRDGTSGKYDAFLAKFKIESSNLNLKSFTFFGGNGDDRIKDINLFHSNATANNNADSIAIVGLTSSNNLNSAGLLSTNADSVSKILHGTEDAFFAVITGTGTTQLHSFACYVGGANIEDEKNSYGPTIALGPIGVEYIGFSTTSSNVKSACKVNTQTGSYNNPGDSSTHDVYVGKIYPFVEHYAAPCPTCNPCKLDGSENSYDAALEFYPVPFNNEVNLKVNALKDAEAMIRIYNSMGQEILRQKISVVQGSNVTKLNLQGQPSGIYLCRILIDNKIETAKIIKE